MKYAYIETYGCSANQSHSELMGGSLMDAGLKKAGNPGKADVIIINTCVVKSPTENKIRDRIKKFVEKYPEKRLVIAGCAADVGMFRDIAPDAEFLSSHRSGDLVKAITGVPGGKHAKNRINPLINITEIASGCLGGCTYCIVRLARGRLKSRSPGEIVEEVNRSVREGCREIWMTSQDCGCYGKDISTNLAVLLNKVSGADGDFMIRPGMMNPGHVKPILEDLVRSFRHEKVYKFVHLPVQSGSDKILRSMKRGYTAKDFKGIVERFRNEIPGMTLSTDIIVGFPGETEEDFAKTCDLIREVKPDVVNLSKFGPRPGTEAAKMNQVPVSVIKKRSAEIGKLIRKIAAERNAKWKGTECDIFVNGAGKKRNQFMGRNGSYKPVVVESAEGMTGRRARVRIKDSGVTHLKGEIIRSWG